jgi:lysophospholipase L1-like esterase
MYKILSILLAFFVSVTAVTVFGQPSQNNPDPGRFADEISAFEQWDSRNSAPGRAVLFTGSSSIRLWTTARAFSEYPVINRGFGGSHIPDLIHYYDRVIGRFDPALIILYCGENDVASGIPPNQVFEDYTHLLDRILNDFPDVHFLYISIKPSNSRIQHTENFTGFNRMVEEFNRGEARLHYIDLAAPLTGKDSRPVDAYFLPDRLHLNEQGYEAWNKLLAPFLDELNEAGILIKKTQLLKPGQITQ